jgi:hypothetical protein
MYVLRNAETRSRNNLCHGKPISITHSECKHMSVVIVIQHEGACVILYYHLWPARLYHIVPLYLIKGTIFGKMFTTVLTDFGSIQEK